MGGFETLYSFNDFLNEARQKDKNVQYDFEYAHDMLKKVIATLKGQKSSAVTKLAKQYHDIDMKVKKLKEEKDDVNDKVKEEMTKYFDVEDSAATRVVESCEFSIRLSATTYREEKKTDYEKILNKLIELHPELSETIDTLIEQYSTIKTKTNKERLSVKSKYEGNEIDEGLSDIISFLGKMFKKFYNKIKRFFDKWDEGFDEINDMAHAAFDMSPKKHGGAVPVSFRRDK